ncbi:patatin-like phospholipase family protein [Bradyrhizobium sp. WSM471]|uniref:patatin-like phospholipase family protein n=1 Tax=Bradyrhizobium sp. WSM471 TaxID=319017 RepID=UPI00024D309F|nr:MULTISPECIES: patatin-like phospholipase family protein [Bradyrhizobium]EHR05769.1 hypothetical protein Bra471DRAFT_06599 [Bradyrhizobium sp. WSM471]UFW40859.1 hypothetical protein BcanWSM471_32385 [Bradyrhizobium canariense]
MNAASDKQSPDQLAAHDLLSELRTRIATQPLPYQYGVETRALESLMQIFGLAREAMKKHPGCREFARITTCMLNVDLRPVTAKWHRAFEAGVLNSKDGANEFRADLKNVRIKLVDFAERLQLLAYGEYVADAVTPDVLDDTEIARCFEPVVFGVDTSSTAGAAINASEAAEVTNRRRAVGIDGAVESDAVGLALSGGGIRSATFCLGVLQVLAARGLMKHFDFLSTVSGGGYTGSFVTARIGSGEPFDAMSNPNGPDTVAIRYVRQNAKYLSAVDLKERLLLVTGTLAGLMLNWMVPLFVLSLLALNVVQTIPYMPDFTWSSLAVVLSILMAMLVLLYGITLRAGVGTRSSGILLALLAAITAASALMAAIEFGYRKFGEALDVPWSVSGTAVAAVMAAPAIIRFLPIFQSDAARKLLMKIALLAAGIAVPILALLGFYLLRRLGGLPWEPEAPWWSPLHHISGGALLVVTVLVSGVYSLFFLNINLTGPHKLYRDRLAKTFVSNGAATDDIALASLNATSIAPYHLINATVNLPSSTSPAVRDRKGDFFLFSKHWSGSVATGYESTSNWKMNGAPVDLATAMAISGAAASPHMGMGSIPSLSALMTLLNIRLGFWIANPSKKTWGVPGFTCLLREMTGTMMTEKNSWLNLSDGGHIENMGVFELLRRRCKFIVCVDGEADPKSTFQGHLTLVRHAQIDLGIRIEPRLDEIRPDPNSRFSRTHSQLFRINYPKTCDGRAEGIGLMLYLKLSLTGDEAELLKRYRSVNPDFPHQSTLDQFYDEEQFEAYRQLGVHVVEGTFAPALMTRNRSPNNVRNWFEQLAANMLEPSN